MSATTVHPIFADYPREVLDKFKQWDKENPEVFPMFKKMAFQIKRTGRTAYSGYNIFYAIRWFRDIKTTGDVFKVNNDYIPIYIRLLIYRHPEFDGFFELRGIRARGIPSVEERKRRGEGDDDEPA